MSPNRKSQPLILGLLVALCIVPGLLVFAALPWLKQQPVGVLYLATGISGAVTIAASLALSIVHNRGMGEWERTNQRFSSFWGEAVGSCLIALLICLPAGREWIVATVTDLAGPGHADQLVFLGFVFGFALTVLTRLACMAGLSIGWTLWKSRAAS